MVARILGVDIRRRGSGNIGATNVLRTLGWTPAIATLVGDVAKGYVATWVGRQAGSTTALGAAAAVLAVVGQLLVRCSSDSAAARAWRPGSGRCASRPWALMPGRGPCVRGLVASTRYVSLASLCAAACVPLGALLLSAPGPRRRRARRRRHRRARHHENIQRLLAGTESRQADPTSRRERRDSIGRG